MDDDRLPQDRQGRRDRFFVMYENDANAIHSLRESAYDVKPMTREDALERFKERVHGVLVEVIPIARKRERVVRTDEVFK